MAQDDLIPMQRAAEQALRKLLPEHIVGNERSRDSLLLVANALCNLIPVYGRDGLARLTESELVAARSGEKIMRLGVKQADLDRAIESLVACYIGSVQSARANPAVAEKPVRAKRVR